MFPVTPKKEAELVAKLKDLGIKEEDLEESFVRGSGRGGQKKNKSSVCVLLKHLPSGLQVRADRERSQGLNRFFARRQMIEAMENKTLGKESPEAKKADKIRKQKARRKRRSSEAEAPSKTTENKGLLKKSTRLKTSS